MVWTGVFHVTQHMLTTNQINLLQAIAGFGIVSGSLAVWDCARQDMKLFCVGLDTAWPSTDKRDVLGK